LKCHFRLNNIHFCFNEFEFLRSGGMIKTIIPPLLNTCAKASYGHGGMMRGKISPSSTCIKLINYISELINFSPMRLGEIYIVIIPPHLYDAFRYRLKCGGMMKTIIPPELSSSPHDFQDAFSKGLCEVRQGFLKGRIISTVSIVGCLSRG